MNWNEDSVNIQQSFTADLCPICPPSHALITFVAKGGIKKCVEGVEARLFVRLEIPGALTKIMDE
jgi:hypothetical protein